MTFATTEKLSSPNCVRLFAQQQQAPPPGRKVLPSSQAIGPCTNNNMDGIHHQFTALRVANSDEQSDNNIVTPCRDKFSPMSVVKARNVIFQILIHMGALSSQFMDVHRITENRTAVGTIMGKMMALLMDLSNGLTINLHDACMKKIQLNQRKYPVELCKVGRLCVICTTF